LARKNVFLHKSQFISIGNVTKQLLHAFSCTSLSILITTCTWEVSRALKEMELFLAAPLATVMPLLKSSNVLHHMQAKPKYESI